VELTDIFSRPLGLAAAVTLALGVATVSDAQVAAAASAVAAPSAAVANETLTITGTDDADTIAIGVASDDPTTLLVDLGNGTLTQRFDRRTFRAISAFLGGGDDQLRVAPGGGIAEDALLVEGGSGNDTIAGADGNDVLSGGPGDDSITGGDGLDLVFGDGGDDVVDGGRGNDVEILGGGADTAVWNPGEANDLIDGGTGSDRLVFNGSNAAEQVTLSAAGDRAVLFRDVASVRMDTESVEGLNLAMLGSADRVNVDDLSSTDLRDVRIDLSVQGVSDGQNDTVTVSGTEGADRIHVGTDAGAVTVNGPRADVSVTGSDPTDLLAVKGLGGDDKVSVSDDARDLMDVVVDLGLGQK